jgi:predicted site-specific integrase-resolvase
MYATPSQTRKHFNISEKTLYNWVITGKIKYINTKGGQRRYIIEDNSNNNKTDFIYARVSSRKQSEDLQRQINFLSKKVKNATVISDIGSGFNYNRIGFQRIIKEVIKGGVNNVYVSNPYCFTRISFDFFKWLFKHFGTKLIAISKPNLSKDSNESEFTEDIIGIITHYTAKYYGKRKYLKINSSNRIETTDTQN